MHLGPENNNTGLTIDFGEYLDGLYSYAVVLSRNHTEAEDLVQETCLRALKAMERLRPDSNIKSWLFTILRNVWRNQLRQSRTAGEVVDLDLENNSANRPIDTAKDPYAAYVSSMERDQVRNAIQQLPLEFREVILLREYEELSYEEIAALLDCPPGTVMSRLARARSKLHDLLAGPQVAQPSERDRRSDSQGTVAWDRASGDE
jgi:RNA polymerase sigma-70 factor (ECF subfamily)